MAEDVLSILFVDAYDSFTQNVIALLHQTLKLTITLVRIDESIEKRYGLSLQQFLAKFDAVVLGPGPGNPHNEADTGLFNPIIRCALQQNLPVLGICLGFQVLCLHFGLPVERLPLPCHGHVKHIIPIEQTLASNWVDAVFYDIDIDNIRATCYNSLGVRADGDVPIVSRPGSSSANSAFSVSSISDNSESPRLSQELKSRFSIIGRDSDGYAMIVSHDVLPLWGVQFHPESCRSNLSCQKLLQNWLKYVQKTRRNVGNHTAFGVQSPSCSSIPLQQSRAHHFKQSTAEEEIFDRLSHATESSGNIVQWRKVSLHCSNDDVSKLVHALSGGSGTAILESTKKGRFSIYAVPNWSSKEQDQSKSESLIDSSRLCLTFGKSVASIEVSTGYNRIMTSIPSNREAFMEVLERFMSSKQATQGAQEIPFWGGFIGYLSYENGLEQIGLSYQQTDEHVNDVDLLWVQRSLVYDSWTSTVYVQSLRKDDAHFIDSMVNQLQSLSSKSLWPKRPLAGATVGRLLAPPKSPRTEYALPDRAKYDAQFDLCQSALLAGESYELCLTTEARVTFTIPHGEQDHYVYKLYQSLQTHNPVPFAAYLDFPSVTILSSSPEQYMSWSREGIIDMIPMKGTVKRTPEMTFERAAAILTSPKEQAENLMIADLIRHDLYSTVGTTSNVEVIKLCEVVEHETVYQLVSHIRAHSPIPRSLSPDSKQQQSTHFGLAALRTTLPPGSMTGAPKKRSCEILQSLEKRNRGVYSGVLGYLDVGGGGCWSVCIRTAFRHKPAQTSDNTTGHHGHKDQTDTWRIGAGGAITVLSDKQAEWEEMNTKLHSVLKGFRID